MATDGGNAGRLPHQMPADTAAQAQAAKQLADDVGRWLGASNAPVDVIRSQERVSSALDALVAELDRLRFFNVDLRRQMEELRAQGDWPVSKVASERAEARAELERVTRDTAEAWTLPDLRQQISDLLAALAAAAGREQRAKALLLEHAESLDPDSFISEVIAVLEEGQQPRRTMAEALDEAGMLHDPDVEEGRP